MWRVHSTFDLDDAETLETGASGGLLRDLGSHLVDQMFTLLGPVRSVSAVLDHAERFGERTDCGFVLTLRHSSGVASMVSASRINHVQTRSFRVYGSEGSYVSDGSDAQTKAIFAGMRPSDDCAS